MPQIITPSPLVAGAVGESYNRPIVAIKIVFVRLRRNGRVFDHDGFDFLDFEYATGFSKTYRVSAEASDDDIGLGPNSVSINQEVNCSVLVSQQPADEVEVLSEEPFVIQVIPDDVGDFSFRIMISNDGPDDPFELFVFGTAIPEVVLVSDDFEIVNDEDLDVWPQEPHLIVSHITFPEGSIGINMIHHQVPEVQIFEDAEIISA